MTWQEISNAPKLDPHKQHSLNGPKILGKDIEGDCAVMWWNEEYPNTGNWVFGKYYLEKDDMDAYLYFYPEKWMEIP